MAMNTMLPHLLLASLLTVAVSAQGELFIAGGGIDLQGEILPEFLACVSAVPRPADQKRAFLEVVTAASSDPGRSLARMLDALRVISMGPLPRGKTLERPTSEAAQRFDDTQGVWFTGGKQSRIVARLRSTAANADKPGVVMRALRNLLHRGGIIGGSSAGAAIMSDPMINGGTSEKALLHGVGPTGVRIARGLGFFPYGLVDQHFLARGRFGRLLVAQHHLGTRFAFGIEENSALYVQLGAKPLCRGVGPNAVTVLELVSQSADAVELRPSLLARLSLLGSGDHFDPRTGASTPREGRVLLPSGFAEGASLNSPISPFSKGALLRGLQRLSRFPRRPVVMKGVHHQVTLSAAGDTRFLVSPKSGADLYASGVLLKITANPQ